MRNMWLILLTWQLFTFATVAYDKGAAIKNYPRPKVERYYHLSILGGGIGILIGLTILRHYRNYKRLRACLWRIVLAQLFLIAVYVVFEVVPSLTAGS